MASNRLIILLLFCSCLAFGQAKLDDSAKRAINLHIEYINACSYYVDATQHSLKDFNKILNAYAELLEEDEVMNHETLELSYGRAKLDFNKQLAAISNKYDSLTLVRNDMSIEDAKSLENVLGHYQKVFEQLKSIVQELIYFTNNKVSFFEDIRFKRAYLLLHAYEKNLRVLAVLNYGFDWAIRDIFEEEELPKPLNRIRNIVLLSKKAIFEIRQARSQKLNMTMTDWMEEFGNLPSMAERKQMESFGDYTYLQSGHNDERRNIERHSNLLYKWAERYLKGEDLLKIDETFDRQYRFEELLINIFNSQGVGIAQKYNEYIDRAHTPILKIVNEVPPFNVTYPEKILLPEEDAAWLTSEGIKKLLFDPDDISTLSGALTNNMVLLLDVSISMRYDEKLDKLKNSVTHLIEVLRPQDKLTVITYSGTAKKVLETNPIYGKEVLKQLISDLKTGGKSNGKAGLQMAYREAEENFIVGGNNRVIIASDGKFKIDKQLKRLIGEKLENGIYLTTFHYLTVDKRGREKEVLKPLAELGGGRYIQIKKKEDAIKALVTESKKQTPNN